ncbi:3117_t:CDS:2, partial [Entrophospora sp. SA101]
MLKVMEDISQKIKKIWDQLCKLDIVGFLDSVNQHKRICLSEKDYQNLCNKAVSIEHLTQRINDLEAELGAYMIEVEKSHNN